MDAARPGRAIADRSTEPVEIYSGPRVKVVRALLTPSSELIQPPSGASIAPVPGQLPDLAPVDGARPCLALVVGWDVLRQSGAAQAIASDVERLRAVRPGQVLPFLGTGRTGDDCYTAVSCVHPTNLGVGLREWRFLGWEETVRILTGVGLALVDAHGAGLIAGRLEPWQVQLAAGGRVGLAVFGPALSLTVRGTDGWVQAPETRDGSPADVASDLHALGVLGIELLTGKTPGAEPLDAARSLEPMRQLLYSLAGREFDVPRAVVCWLARLTSTVRTDRPGSTEAALEEIESVTRREAEQARHLAGDGGSPPPLPETGSDGLPGFTGTAEADPVPAGDLLFRDEAARPVRRSGPWLGILFAVTVGLMVWLAGTALRSGLLTGFDDPTRGERPAFRREAR